MNKTWLILAPVILLSACVSKQVITINATPALAAVADVAEDLLLDVGITVFDPNVPEDVVEQNEMQLVAGVRNAEARYMPYVLRDTLQDTGHWGAVRVVPRGSETVDLIVTARLMTSDGERLSLVARAYDSTGRVWLDDEKYADVAGKLNYREDLTTSRQDPFQDLYNQIANDLLEFREAMSPKDLSRVRQVSQIKFAADLSPEAFGDYLVENNGRTALQRLPALDDPMLLRAEKIRERDYVFIDTLDQHYGSFHNQVRPAYNDWRRFNYEEVVRLRYLEREIRRRTITGAALIVGGLAVSANSDDPYTEYGGLVATVGGIYSIYNGIKLRPKLLVHAETMRELGDSFELEVRPAVLEVEGKTITLSGSVDSQFEQWRELLREIYVTDT
ncbi:MAG: hypothetical protein OES99_11195, partial [Gammaproteobacteria bacterium]|nr:hypothetical protein [Gammaproteobacteria bacterium]